MAKVTISVIDGQSLADISLQHYGSVDGIKQLFLDNPDKVSFESKPVPGTELIIDTDLIIDKKVVEFFKQQGVLPPATAYLNLNHWCIAYGRWDDTGRWVDSETWFDN